MVERPIKRSERQNVADAASKVVKEDLETEPSAIENSPESMTQSPKERNIPRPSKDKDKTKGKGRGNQEEARSSPVSAALMRGPKPTKPKPPVVKKTESDAEDETIQDTTDQDS